MESNGFRTACRVSLFGLLWLFAIGSEGFAVSYYWNGPATTPDAGGGTGTWDTTTTNWMDALTGGSSVAWPSSGVDNDAVFGALAGTVSVAAGGVSVNDVTFNSTGYEINGGSLTLNGTTPLITAGTGISATISSIVSGSVSKRGAGTLTLTGSSTASLGDSQQGTLQLNAGTWSLGTAFRLTAVGDGTLTVNNSGTAVSSAGNVVLTSTANARTASLNVANGSSFLVNGTLQTNRGSTSEIGQVSVSNSSSLTVTGGLDVGKNLGGANDRTRGAFTSNGEAVVSIAGSTRLSNSGDNSHGTATLSILGNSAFSTSQLQLRPVREKGAAILAVVNDTATLTATGGVLLTTADRASSNVATTTTLRIAGQGTLLTNGITSSPNVGNTTLQLELQGGTLKASASNPTFITGFSASPVISNAGIVFDSNGFDMGIDVGLAGATGFVRKVGAGTVRYRLPVTYGGATAVEAGTLEVASAGAISSSSGVTLNGSTAVFRYDSATPLSRPLTLTQGTLTGTGTIATAVVAGSGSRLSPGNSPGIQPFSGGLQLSGLGSYLWEINNASGEAGTAWDLIDVTGGTLDLSALDGGSASTKYVLDLVTLADSVTPGQMANYDPSQAYSFQMFRTVAGGILLPGNVTASGGENLTSLFTVNPGGWSNPAPSAGYEVRVSSGGTGIDLVTVVPEPAAIGLVGCGLAAAAWGLRRRRTSRSAA